MSAVSTQHLFFADGKANIFAWILFIATLILVFFAIRQAYIQTRKIQVSDEEQQRKLAELELNLRAVRGGQYQSVTPALKQQP